MALFIPLFNARYEASGLTTSHEKKIKILFSEDEAKNFIYSCASLTETNLMTSLRILDPDRDYPTDRIFHQGGEDRQYYNFEPVTGSSPNPLDIRYDSAKKTWGLYSTDVSFDIIITFTRLRRISDIIY